MENRGLLGGNLFGFRLRSSCSKGARPIACQLLVRRAPSRNRHSHEIEGREASAFVGWARRSTHIKLANPTGPTSGSLETTGYVNDKSNVRRAVEPFHCQRDQSARRLLQHNLPIADSAGDFGRWLVQRMRRAMLT
jgi:hypothetical protein